MRIIPKVPLDGAYRPAVTFALVTQVILLFVSLLILDGGDTTRRVVISMVAFWCAAVVLILRNPGTAKKSDLLYLRAGFFPVLLLTYMIASLIWDTWGFG